LQGHAQDVAHAPALREVAVESRIGRGLVRHESLASLVDGRVLALALQREVKLSKEFGRGVVAGRFGAHLALAPVEGRDEPHLAACETRDRARESARYVGRVGERREGARYLEEAAKLLVALPTLFE